ncbi:TPA: hypothetical protein BOS_15486 [Bos taurus]|nr:TPA: hypothetical protein BOS_15486 [Bos taurus]
MGERATNSAWRKGIPSKGMCEVRELRVGAERLFFVEITGEFGLQCDLDAPSVLACWPPVEAVCGGRTVCTLASPRPDPVFASVRVPAAGDPGSQSCLGSEEGSCAPRWSAVGKANRERSSGATEQLLTQGQEDCILDSFHHKAAAT